MGGKQIVKTIIGSVAGLVLVLLAASAPAATADDAAHVQILSATIRDQKLRNASVILQKNGEQSSATSTDAAGRAQLRASGATDPASLLIVRKEGYSDLVAKCPCAGMTYALSPKLERLDGMRVVLNWGREPADLDGHLGFEDDHVFFLKKAGTDAQLDVDHTDGFGPETITITRRHSGHRYVYAVQDFSGRSNPISSGLSRSDAKVFVYVGQTLVRSYYVPKNRVGNLWTVFAVSEDGEIQDINTLSGIFASQPEDLTLEKVFGSGKHAAVAATRSTPANAPAPAPVPDSAKKLNTQGEAAYRRGEYQHAIDLFQDAIGQHAGYGQAYSNLGLTYGKMGRVAEALWANRKAIALASGPSASTTRASTHFNNGRIYEDALQWDDALREYERAIQEKSSSVYENAIERMRQHGAR
jgi:hypothetical protein